MPAALRFSTRFHLVVPVLRLLLCGLSGEAFAASSFVQDRIAIGLWVPPQTSENLEQRYREIAEANFTVVIGTAGMAASEQIALCERFGLKAIVQAPPKLGDLADGPACWGYLLTDEPNASAFPDLAVQADAIRKTRPGRLAYVNLFPNYASPAQLGTSTYEEHVARFMKDFKPEVLSMDHYPLMRPDRDTRDAYCANLEVLRRHALEARIPFWNYFYSMPFNDRTDPTEAQIRWQIFASLAHGAKGVLYFCYWTPGKGNGGTGEFPKGGALLTAEGRKTRHYDEARRINAEVRNLGPALMNLTSTGVQRVATLSRHRNAELLPKLTTTEIQSATTQRHATNGLSAGPLRSLERVGSDPHSEFLIGSFLHTDGRRAVLMVNQSYAHTAWPTAEFDASPDRILEVDKGSGKEAPVVDDSPELPGIQLSFGPGDGRLFILP